MNEELSALETLSTTTVSDALDRIGIAGQCLGIKPLDLGFRLCGPAFTMRTIPVAVEAGTVGDYIDDVPPGHIVTIDNAGRQDMTVWGDILTFVADRRGIGGTVIDGVCRDVARSLELKYPLFTRGWSMRTGKTASSSTRWKCPSPSAARASIRGTSSWVTRTGSSPCRRRGRAT